STNDSRYLFHFGCIDLYIPPFPTRRSSDLLMDAQNGLGQGTLTAAAFAHDGNGFPRVQLKGDSIQGPDITDFEEAHAANFEVSRSEEHTSELQSRENLVCRLLLEKKKSQSH